VTTKHYLGIVEKDAESVYGIWFPDMPGWFPAADKLDDLPRVAAEMLRLHIEALESNRRAIPPPRLIRSDVMNDGIVREAIGAGLTTMLISD
jgi:predicted RNase H-like HicB family nuclease